MAFAIYVTIKHHNNDYNGKTFITSNNCQKKNGARTYTRTLDETMMNKKMPPYMVVAYSGCTEVHRAIVYHPCTFIRRGCLVNCKNKTHLQPKCNKWWRNQNNPRNEYGCKVKSSVSSEYEINLKATVITWKLN